MDAQERERIEKAQTDIGVAAAKLEAFLDDQIAKA